MSQLASTVSRNRSVTVRSPTSTRKAGGGCRSLRLPPLGSHRFHGLREALAIFQVMGPDLPARFPPLRTLAEPEEKD